MYFIDHGKVDVILDNDEVVNKLGDGAHFGGEVKGYSQLCWVIIIFAFVARLATRKVKFLRPCSEQYQ